MMSDETAGGLVTEDSPPPLGPRRARAGLNDQAQKRLGLHLRTMYESIVQQPVPDRFKDLIAQLDDRAEGGESA